MVAIVDASNQPCWLAEACDNPSLEGVRMYGVTAYELDYVGCYVCQTFLQMILEESLAPKTPLLVRAIVRLFSTQAAVVPFS